jgi:hypothetical protein
MIAVPLHPAVTPPIVLLLLRLAMPVVPVTLDHKPKLRQVEVAPVWPERFLCLKDDAEIVEDGPNGALN